MTDTDAIALKAATIDRQPIASLESPREQPLSDFLLGLSCGAAERLTIRDLVGAMQDRSFGAFLLIFALPNLVPLPPGATTITGLPLVWIAWQMLASRQDRVTVPGWLGDYGIGRSTFVEIVNRLLPWLRRAETWLKPRHWFLTGRLGERLVGLLVLVLGVIIVLPIPLGNGPPAIAIALIGFAHSQRDGIGLAIGCAAGILSFLVVCLVLVAAGALISVLF